MKDPRGNDSDPSSYDVLVVGAGGAGLSAAIAAAEAGARVVILEKAERPGGTTSLSVGSITAAGTALQARAGIADTADAHYEDMDLLPGQSADRDQPALRRVLVDEVGATVDWLESLGVVFVGPFSEAPHRLPRMHVALPNSRTFAFHLEKRCRELGIPILCRVAVESLVFENGAVAGLVARTHGADDGAVRSFSAGSVILATGDYSAAGDLKQRFLPTMVDIDPINPLSTGDGHRMALGHGAFVRNGDLAAGPKFRFKPPRGGFMADIPPNRWLARAMRFAFQHLPAWLLRPFLLPTLTSYLAPEPALFAAGAILVNRNGARFTDELRAPAADLPRQPGKEGYIVLDERLARQFDRWPYFVSTAPGIAYAYLKDYERIRRDVHASAPSAEALGQRLGMPAGALARTIEAHNGELRLTGGSSQPLTEGPFHALGPLYSWVVVTQGGLAVDAQHRVIREDGSAIPGLYAAGTAGLGGLYVAGHGHYLGWAFTSGRRAGKHAAGRHARPGH
ncbi:MAG: FAD-dependent oxidoreductase [Burkholderiaceae bacterium]